MSDENGKALGENLRLLRVKRGITQAHLGRAAGMHRNTITSIEMGRIANPGVWTLYPLALALGCRLEDIMGVSRIESSTKGRVRTKADRAAGAKLDVSELRQGDAPDRE